MKKPFSLLLFIIHFSFFIHCSAQNRFLDSLRTVIKEEKQDTNKVLSVMSLGFFYAQMKNTDSSEYYINQARDLAGSVKNDKFNASILWWQTAYYMLNNINYQKSLELAFSVLKLDEKIGDSNQIARSWGLIASVYNNLEDMDQCIYYNKKSRIFLKRLNDLQSVMKEDDGIGYAYIQLNMPDSALVYLQESCSLLNTKPKGWDTSFYTFTYYGMGKANYQLGNLFIAMAYYKKSYEYVRPYDRYVYLSNAGLGELYNAMGNRDSAIIYYNKALSGTTKTKKGYL